MKRIGIFGGTFDPPHLGHLKCANAAREELGLTQVLFIPNRLPAYKVKEHAVSKAGDRLNMLGLLIKDCDWAEISDIELRREGNTYTSDTLRELHILYPEDELVLIIGSDSLCSLKSWHEPKTVCSLSTIAVLNRNTDTSEKIIKAKEELEEDFGARIILINNMLFELSSTQIREAVKRREKLPEGIPEEIIQYIEKRNLYI